MGQSSIKLYISLNIQRFSAGGSVSCDVLSQDIGSNTSRVRINFTVTRTGGSTYWNDNKTVTISCDGQNATSQIKLPSSQTSSTCSAEFTIGHNSDGTKIIGFSASVYPGSSIGTISASGAATLPTIPRYANITSFNVSKRDETSVTVNFGVDATIDYCQYRLGTPGTEYWGNWIDTGVSADSRQFIIGSLSPNTPTSYQIRVKRADSQLWKESSRKEQTTYDYPRPTSINNFIIGDGATVNLDNPLGRNCTLQILQVGTNTVLGTYSGTYSGNVNAEFKTAEAIEAQYQSIPNSASGTYYAKVTYGGNTRTKGNGTYSVNTDTNKPDFNLFEFEDINATTLALTGDSQKCVIGYSTIQATVSVSNKATAKNSASMSYYQLEIGANTPQTSNYSSSEDVTISIANATSNTYKVSAIDSRGLSKPVTLTSASPIQYENITKDISNSSFLRSGGVSEFATLTLSGKIWYGNFGQVNNAINSVTYRFKKPSDNDWTPGTTTITPTVDNQGNFTFEGSIAGNNADNGFDVDSVYQLEVTVSDKLSSTTYSFTLGSGVPHVAYARTGVSFMGKYDDNEGGEIQINGKKIYGTVIYDYPSGDNGDISLNDNIANYEYLEIYYKTNDGYYSSMKIPTSAGVACLMGFQSMSKSGPNSYIKFRVIYFDVNSIKTYQEYYKELRLDSDANSITNNEYNYIYITRVIGYKF